MKHFSKQEKRELQKLVGLAYARELAKALDELNEKFLEWKEDRVDSFELNNHIHKFHNGISRDLWNMYDNRNNYIAVTRAIVNGIISKNEITIKLLEALEPGIETFKDL